MKTKLREILATAIDVDSDELTDVSSPDNTPEWDSFAHMTMVAAMEEEFKIALTLDEVKSMQTLPIIEEVISQKL
ncbi:MAG: acyl carrier protein [Nitrospina sp.]|jgi:acyl carrier protein|nr:acyl carrier protein [Nitrospina sp.]MBT3414025.1 acyl carrier protein [Nitrospina sp.]MBT3856452.1 acyl carrier protein [Nitrospina sp.]MBT4105649.1 acyl carrier protein [Nitrospina sp.]MBT4389447.1 acyl carrier protein [Nitrospina sp.]